MGYISRLRLLLLIVGTSIWIYENDTDSAVRFGIPDKLHVMALNAHQGFETQQFPLASGYLRVTLFKGENSIQLVGTHLAWGEAPEAIEVRRQEVVELLDMLEPDIPAIIMGDMNR